jgi:hypothetical protein
MDAPMLGLVDFIEENKIELDMKLWRMFGDMPENQWLYVTDEMIALIGYSGVPKAKKSNFKTALETRWVEGVEFMWFIKTEYTAFYKQNGGSKMPQWPVPTTSMANNLTHVIVKPRAFKEIALSANPRKTNRVRRYFLQLKSLTYAYLKYQCAF